MALLILLFLWARRRLVEAPRSPRMTLEVAEQWLTDPKPDSPRLAEIWTRRTAEARAVVEAEHSRLAGAFVPYHWAHPLRPPKPPLTEGQVKHRERNESGRMTCYPPPRPTRPNDALDEQARKCREAGEALRAIHARRYPAGGVVSGEVGEVVLGGQRRHLAEQIAAGFGVPPVVAGPAAPLAGFVPLAQLSSYPPRLPGSLAEAIERRDTVRRCLAASKKQLEETPASSPLFRLLAGDCGFLRRELAAAEQIVAGFELAARRYGDDLLDAMQYANVGQL